MFKLVISLSVIATFWVVSLNLDFSSSDIDIEETTVEKLSLNSIPKEEESLLIEASPNSIVEHKKIKDENNLLKEITYLLEKANLLSTSENYEEALKIYDEIILKVECAGETDLLEYFAKASFAKASLVKNYLEDEDESLNIYTLVAEKLGDSSNTDLLKLYANAQFLKSTMTEQDESIEIYNEIIEKFKESDEVELLKNFAYAQFSKAYLLTNSESIEIYDEIIQKFKDKEDKELLKELSNAQFSKALILSDFLQDKKEAIEVYTEIIEKFDCYEDDDFREEVDNALFAKSFLLMDENSEESMKIFDKLIAKYKDTEGGTVPKNLEYSIINNIELALITNNSDIEYQELATQYLWDSKEGKAQVEMLEILKNAQDLNQDERLEVWKKEHESFYFENWSFKELEKWNQDMESSESKTRIKKYLTEFQSHNSSRAMIDTEL